MFCHRPLPDRLEPQDRIGKRYAAGGLIAIALLLVMVGIATCTTGCTALPTPQQAQQTLDSFKAEEADLKVRLADLRAQAATRPSDTAIVSGIDRLQSRIDQLDKKVIPAADAAVKSYSDGKPDALVGVISGQFGPWGTLAGIAVTVGWGVYQKIQQQKAQKALVQTVQGLNAVPMSEEQKTALAAAQDSSTKVQIATIKAT